MTPHAETCLICGYDIAGLDDAASCPECSAGIGDSRHGGLMASAPDGYVRLLIRGALLIEIAIICILTTDIVADVLTQQVSGGMIVNGAFDWPRIRLLNAIISGGALFALLLNALGNLGWWWVSTPDPRFEIQERATPWRRMLRAGLIAFILVAGVEFALLVDMLYMRGTRATNPMTLFALQAAAATTMLVTMVNFFLMVQYVRILARRAGSDRLRTYATRMLWLGPLLALLLYVAKHGLPDIFADARIAIAVSVTTAVVWLLIWGGMIELLRQTLVKARQSA